MVDISVTDEAAELLTRSLQMTGIDAATGGVRLRVARGLGGGGEVQVELAAERDEGFELVEIEGLRLFVDPALAESVPDPLVAVEPMHDQIVVRPAADL